MSEGRNGARVEGFVIPVTVDDLAANGLLGEAPPSPSASAGQFDRQVCWMRSAETLIARKDDIEGFAIASDEQIEAYVLYVTGGTEETEILSLRSFVDDGGARLEHLFSHLRARGMKTLRMPRVHPSEIPIEWLQRLGFTPASRHVVYRATARSG
jgi:hypothetical protein